MADNYEESMIFNKPKLFYILLFALLALNALFFVPLIIKLPDFMMDDFMLFSIIDKNPAAVILINPGEIVHLAVRPLTFFSFWFDHVVLNFSSFQMKLETLFIHLCFVTSFSFFAFDMLSYLKIKVSPIKLSVVTLILTTHTICTWWIMWVALRNEILMILFYVLSFYSVLLFLKSDKNYFLFLSLLFYIFSFLSKQQSLHLPLIIFAVIFFFKDSFTQEQRKKLAYLASFGLVLMIIYFAINLLYYQSTSLLQFSGLWKKPLSAVSAIGLALFPLETDKIYNFLLSEKIAAVVVFGICLGLAFFVYVRRIQSRKTFLFLAGAFAISFFPVLSAEITLRLITLQVFLIYLAGAYFIHKIKVKDYVIYGALAVMLFLNVRASLVQFNGERSINEKRNESVVKLDGFLKAGSVRSGNALILASPFGSFIPYQYYFYKYNKFGKDSVSSSPFGYTYYFKNFYSEEVGNRDEIVMSAKKTDSLYSVFATKEYIVFFKGDKLDKFIVAHDERAGLRGYSEIEFKMPEQYKNYIKIYYDGVNWQKLSP